MYGITKPGLFYIYPDGELSGHEPFIVYCNFMDGSTQEMHDKDFAVEIAPCPESMCFQLDLTYNTAMEQITALKDISEDCSQAIQFDCFQSGLSDNGDPVGAWLNKDGLQEIYFCQH